jgi:hypothetical protein
VLAAQNQEDVLGSLERDLLEQEHGPTRTPRKTSEAHCTQQPTLMHVVFLPSMLFHNARTSLSL